MDKGTTKLAYMRAALSSLATIHGTTFSFMRSIGGKEALLEQFHTIKEHHLPRNKVVRRMVEESMLPFLMYMTRVQPDIAQQLMVESSYRYVVISPSIITSGFGKIQQILVSSLQRSAEERKFSQIEDLGARRR